MGYVLDNAWHSERDRLRALESIWDPGTKRVISSLGISEGWRCLEAGAGGGSIAEWMCQQVGASGRVVATDIDTRFIEAVAADNLEVARNDLTADDLPAGPYDLIHARALVEHLPEPEAIIRKLAAALAPGGWLVLEDFDWDSSSYAAGPSKTYERTSTAVMTLMAAAGYRKDFGRDLPRSISEAGLELAGAEGRCHLIQGGTDQSLFYLFTLQQLADGLVGSGLLTRDDIDEAVGEMTDPENFVMSPVVVAAWGRRPL